jgi:hypothetical protein
LRLWGTRAFAKALSGRCDSGSDWLRLGSAAVAVVIVTRHASDSTASERALDDLVRSFGGALDGVWRELYGGGALWVVGLIFAAALVARRLQLALELLIAGVVVRALGRTLRHVVGTMCGWPSSRRRA